ncbi:LuxR C-terminal-related transcriptional regulator [Mycolicibacterium sp. 141076]|uniref:LuxR C-terminal-related transcriptional regulator n=1 Tax=Mycobacteriaceae TaxID=1762 RepID=UPI00299E630C|nr:LuxR C-terminal-related transcriptional regulator [Mycolicibacterium sp. 141076]MDX1877139.1 LuxR C-terminal-related transcriptional regulator [Mycolicibacterium sp. 141076]
MIHEWPLHGRAEELRAIETAIRRPDRARGIVLSGAAGVGKTRLAREVVTACRPPGRSRWIAGTASARSIPLGAFADIASDFGPDPLRRVREVIDGVIGAAPTGAVVVGVDDAHLLDDLSAFAVHQLVARKLATVVLTLRSGEPAPDAITAIWKDDILERIELQPLSSAAIAKLVERILGGPVHSRCVQQLWQYTQGNVLYLRHLLDTEVSAGRLTQQSGVWMWQGQPRLTPTLAELLTTRIGQIPAAARNVLDALAVTEPLDIETLAAVTDSDAIAETEALGLIRIDGSATPASVRLAHPMLGEVRRTDSLRMRRLHGQIAAALIARPATDPRDLVRRAVLTLNSDLAPDPAILNAATSAAIQLTDMRLAESLAERAVAAGGGLEADIALSLALIWQERGEEAEVIFARLAADTSGPLRVQVALLRALNFAVILGHTARAEAELDSEIPAGDATVAATALALRASIDVARGRSTAAIEQARRVVDDPAAEPVAQMLSTWALVSSLGELGRIDEVETVAEAGYRLADTSAEVSHLRLPLAFLHLHMHRLAGTLDQADVTIARIRRDTVDVPIEGSWQVAESWHAFVAGLSAVSRGALVDAHRLCPESLADFSARDSGSMRKMLARLWLVTADAMAGRAEDARREFAATPWWQADPDACARDPDRTLAHAWVCAAEGAVSEAISIARAAAARERQLGRLGWEVMLLQTATQFGDRTTAARLAELALTVRGPRAAAAAAHAVALAAADGDGLVAAAKQYEYFGDRVAAADAAAQAAAVYQQAGLRGSGLGAASTAARLAAECGGADTPALRAAATPLAITARQREIVGLAAKGLSNTAIAERLGMSRRSVEGHIFRACQRVGVNSRDQLVELVFGRR